MSSSLAEVARAWRGRWHRWSRARLDGRIARYMSRYADLDFDLPDAVVDEVVARRSERVVEITVERYRGRVVEVLAHADPVYAERALSFSQEGEDLILSRLLEGREPGVFVDVGAYHPYRFSNTYLLYRQGWRGINIDATPGSMRLFRELRPADVNIECFVGNSPGERMLTLYNEPALNTASAEVLAERVLPQAHYWRTGNTVVQTRRLADILREHLHPDAQITVLNIDVEGAELEVLTSNEWERFRPEIILVEQLATDLDGSSLHPTTLYLQNLGYQMVAKALNTAVFRHPIATVSSAAHVGHAGGGEGR